MDMHGKPYEVLSAYQLTELVGLLGFEILDLSDKVKTLHTLSIGV